MPILGPHSSCSTRLFVCDISGGPTRNRRHQGARPVQPLSWTARCADPHVLLDADPNGTRSTSASTLSSGRRSAAGPTDLRGSGDAEASQDRGDLLPGLLGGELWDVAALDAHQPGNILGQHDLQHLQTGPHRQGKQPLTGRAGQLGESDGHPLGQVQLGLVGDGGALGILRTAVPSWSSFLADARHLPHGRPQAGTATSTSTGTGTISSLLLTPLLAGSRGRLVPGGSRCSTRGCCSSRACGETTLRSSDGRSERLSSQPSPEAASVVPDPSCCPRRRPPARQRHGHTPSRAVRRLPVPLTHQSRLSSATSGPLPCSRYCTSPWL
jgi:hypothetical protein